MTKNIWPLRKQGLRGGRRIRETGSINDKREGRNNKEKREKQIKEEVNQHR